MKKLNFLSKLCRLSRASQYCDVGIDRRLTVGSPSVLHRLSQYIAVMFLLLVGGAGNVWGTNPTVTYTVTSTSAVTTSGIAPDNSSATFSQTYETAKQATAGNSFTLTLSNFSVKKVVGFKFSMHSNSGQGSGNLSYKVDNGSETWLVGDNASSAIGFNSWGDNTAYGNSYRDVNWSSLNLTPSSSLVIYVRCVTTNSIYVESFTIEYESDPYTVSFVTGAGNPPLSARTEESGGDGITLPSKSDLTPAASAEGWELFGWATESYAESSSAPTSTLVGLAGAAYYPTKNITLYAVYRQGGVGVGDVVFSESFDGFSADDVPTSSNGSTYVDGGGTLTYTCTGSGTKIYDDNTGGGTSPEILVKASGTFKISTIPYCSASTLTLTFKRNNNALTPSVTGTDYSIAYVSGTGKATYTYTITVGSVSTFDLTFTAGGSNVRLDDIAITVASTASEIWYNSNPCVGLGSISGSITFTNIKTRTMTASWSKTSGDHETGYSVQLYDNNGSGGQGSASGAPISITGKETANRTHTFTGLLPNHKYFVGVTPTYSGAGNYCEEGTEVTGNATTDAGYTVTYAKGTGATGTMTDTNSPYDAGATVTVLTNTFENCGAIFNAWSAKKADETAIDVSSGSFTMPASNVTITATWTNKQDKFYDYMHENHPGGSDYYSRSGAYTTPAALSNTTPGDGCEGKHYIFMGWVEADYINEDGTLKDGYTLIPGSESGHCADTKTFYAIWAEEE